MVFGCATFSASFGAASGMRPVGRTSTETSRGMPHYLPKLKPSDVLGQTLIEITQKYERRDGGVDFAWNFYRLGSGLIVTLGFSVEDGDPMIDEAVPLEASSALENVYGHQIVSVWIDEPEFEEDVSYSLMMENGYIVMEILHQELSVYPPDVYIVDDTSKIDWKLNQFWP